MTTLITEIYYGMYSDEGNMAVHGIVTTAKSQNLTWAQTYKALRDLADSNPDSFGETMDTMVREMVYDAIGADKRGECFYI
jgi:hypothetical protein